MSTALDNDRLLGGGPKLGHASTTITEQAYAELLDSTIAAEVLAVTG